MKPPSKELRAAAGDMVGQLRPRSILRDAIDLLRKFGSDDVVRGYLADRIWHVTAVVLVFFLVSTLCSIDLMFRIAAGSGFLLKLLAVCIGTSVWLAGFLAQTYVFLIWFEERATLRHREEAGIRVNVPHGFLAYLKYSRALPPWLLVALCVALPLLIMARHAWLQALILAVLASAAPAIFKVLDARADPE